MKFCLKICFPVKWLWNTERQFFLTEKRVYLYKNMHLNIRIFVIKLHVITIVFHYLTNKVVFYLKKAVSHWTTFIINNILWADHFWKKKYCKIPQEFLLPTLLPVQPSITFVIDFDYYGEKRSAFQPRIKFKLGEDCSFTIESISLFL